MSQDQEKQSTFNHTSNDAPDLVVERHPGSNLSLLAVVVLVVLLAMLIFNMTNQVIEGHVHVKSPQTEIGAPIRKVIEKKSVDFHQLVSNGTIEDIEKEVYSKDKAAMNEVVNGMTPIMLAASRGDVQIIDLLFTQGADPNKRGSAQRTALQYATEKNHVKAAKRLLAYGADIDAFDNGRLTPLIMAADRGYTELGLFFIQKGANVDVQHAQGWTALIDAARNGDETLVKALLAVGADKDIEMKNGMRALDLAKQYEHKNIVKILGG